MASRSALNREAGRLTLRLVFTGGAFAGLGLLTAPMIIMMARVVDPTLARALVGIAFFPAAIIPWRLGGARAVQISPKTKVRPAPDTGSDAAFALGSALPRSLTGHPTRRRNS